MPHDVRRHELGIQPRSPDGPAERQAHSQAVAVEAILDARREYPALLIVPPLALLTENCGKLRRDRLFAHIRDFERLAQPTGPDPLIMLWSKWFDAYKSELPEGMEEGGKEEDRFSAEICELMQDIEAQIMAEPPKTVAGAHAQLGLILEWLEMGMSNDTRGHYARLRQSVNRNLSAMAAGQGATS